MLMNCSQSTSVRTSTRRLSHSTPLRPAAYQSHPSETLSHAMDELESSRNEERAAQLVCIHRNPAVLLVYYPLCTTNQCRKFLASGSAQLASVLWSFEKVLWPNPSLFLCFRHRPCPMPGRSLTDIMHLSSGPNGPSFWRTRAPGRRRGRQSPSSSRRDWTT